MEIDGYNCKKMKWLLVGCVRKKVGDARLSWLIRMDLLFNAFDNLYNLY